MRAAVAGHREKEPAACRDDCVDPRPRVAGSPVEVLDEIGRTRSGGAENKEEREEGARAERDGYLQGSRDSTDANLEPMGNIRSSVAYLSGRFRAGGPSGVRGIRLRMREL